MSCGDLCVLGGDFDRPDFYHAKTVTARKDHRCVECGETIEPGQRYERAFARCDNFTYGGKTCAPCVEIRDALMCDGWIFGNVWGDITEQAFPRWARTSPMDCLAQLDSLEARAKLWSRFYKWLEDSDG